MSNPVCGANKTTDDFGTVRCMKEDGHRSLFHFHVTEYGYRISWVSVL